MKVHELVTQIYTEVIGNNAIAKIALAVADAECKHLFPDAADTELTDEECAEFRTKIREDALSFKQQLDAKYDQNKNTTGSIREQDEEDRDWSGSV